MARILTSTLLFMFIMASVHAQNFTMNESISMSSFEEEVLKEKDKVWVVDFWASWCGPCVKVIPHLKKDYETFKDQPVQFISLSWDKSDGAWRAAVEKFKMEWPQLLIDQTQMDFINKNFPHKYIPSLFIVHKNGKVDKVNDPYKLEEEVKKALEK